MSQRSYIQSSTIFASEGGQSNEQNNLLPFLSATNQNNKTKDTILSPNSGDEESLPPTMLLLSIYKGTKYQFVLQQSYTQQLQQNTSQTRHRSMLVVVELGERETAVSRQFKRSSSPPSDQSRVSN